MGRSRGQRFGIFVPRQRGAKWRVHCNPLVLQAMQKAQKVLADSCVGRGSVENFEYVHKSILFDGKNLLNVEQIDDFMKRFPCKQLRLENNGVK